MEFRYHTQIECVACGLVLEVERVRVGRETTKVVFTYLVHPECVYCSNSGKMFEDPTLELELEEL